MSTALILYNPQTALERADVWAQLPDEERKRQAAAAAQMHDADKLWGLTESWHILQSSKGAKASPLTLRNYYQVIMPQKPPRTEKERQRRLAKPSLTLLDAWTQENLLKPSRLAGTRWVRALEGRGYIAATVRVYLAGGRALYAALRGAGATDADPFKDVHAAPDPTSPYTKRGPYADEEIDRLLAVAEGDDRLLVLLGARAGLRVAEMVALRWENIDFGARELTVLHGKGGKMRTVGIAASLYRELHAQRTNGSAYVLPYDRPPEPGKPGRPITRQGEPSIKAKTDKADYRLEHLCRKAGVTYRKRGVHGLRHTTGTHLWRETENVRHVMQMLGHSNPATSLVYMEYADDTLKKVLDEW